MEVLNLDSPVVFSSPAFFSIQTNEPRKRRSRKRSFSDMEDSDDSERSRSQTPTKRRKSAEGYICDKPKDYIYATPKPDTIHRYEDSEELRPEGKSTKPRKRKADVFLFGTIFSTFCTGLSFIARKTSNRTKKIKML